MVRVAPPPPERPPNPLFHLLSAGTHLIRLFDPSDHHASALRFRHFGPIHRFDHQRGQDGQRAVDADRGIYYVSLSLAGSLVEIFGDSRFINRRNWHVAYPRLTRDVRLLDLRGPGAMRGGSVAALAKVADRALTQEWSRFFYERADLFPGVEGLIYYNAHNDDDAIALYERAADALDCPEDSIIRLDSPDLLPVILDLAERHNLEVLPLEPEQGDI